VLISWAEEAVAAALSDGRRNVDADAWLLTATNNAAHAPSVNAM
jgi:hypothetical protein